MADRPDFEARAAVVDLGAFRVPVASLEDLIQMKLAAGRPKDQIHLLELRALQGLREESASGEDTP